MEQWLENQLILSTLSAIEAAEAEVDPEIRRALEAEDTDALADRLAQLNKQRQDRA